MQQSSMQPTAGQPLILPSVVSQSNIQARENYRNTFMSLLDLDLYDEQAEVQSRLKRWSVKRLRSEGLTITDLKAEVTVRDRCIMK